jgi:ABC-2 type transport system permease protein
MSTSNQALPLPQATPQITPKAAPTRTTPKNPTFARTVLSEAIRLNRRTFLGTGIVFMIGLTLLATILTFVGASDTGDGDGDRGGFGGMAITAELQASDGIVTVIRGSSSLLGIVVLSLAAVAVASDYSTGLIRLLVQAEPRRWRLMAGKLTALTGLTVVAALLATIVSVGASLVMAPLTDISTAAWSDGVVGTLLTTFLNVTLGLFVWVVIGFVIAVATRSTAAAIAGGVGYIVVFESLLGLISEDIASWLPGSVIQSLVAGGDDNLSYGMSLGLSAAYVVLGLAISLVIFQRRDITA